MGFQKTPTFHGNTYKTIIPILAPDGKQFFLTFHSNVPTAIPEAAPAPAKPMKCPLPTLLENSDAPT